MQPITNPDPVVIAMAARQRDPSRCHNLLDLLPVAEQAPEFRSVFIDPLWSAGIEEYDGQLDEAYRRLGADAVVDKVLRYLAVVVPALKGADPDFFEPRSDCSYFEVIFYSHPSEYHQVRAIIFDEDGVKAESIR